MGNFEFKVSVMDDLAIRRSITRITHEILEHNQGAKNLVLVGIVRRGFELAQKIAAEIQRIENVSVEVGSLDISFYRDDITRAIAPVLHKTSLPFELDGKHVILVDDVLFTGRTIRSAMDALIDFGRPATIQLAVMVDRGHRELPIRADYVGKNVPSSSEEDVRVCLSSHDGHTSVEIWQRKDAENATSHKDSRESSPAGASRAERAVAAASASSRPVGRTASAVSASSPKSSSAKACATPKAKGAKSQNKNKTKN